MDANGGAQPKQNVLKNETPAIFSEFSGHAVLLLEKYGWFILVGVIIALILWSKIEPYWRKWKRKRDEELEQKHIDPVTLAKTQEAIEMSRRKMQEITNKKAAEFAEKMKEVEEKKRQEKIADWERHQQGRGYKSKQHKPPENEQNEQNSKVKPKRNARLRNSDYSPLGGSSSGSSFRPASRRNTGGG